MLNESSCSARGTIFTFLILVATVSAIALTLSLLFYHQLGSLIGYVFALMILLPLLVIAYIMHPDDFRRLLPVSFHIFVCAITDIIKYVVIIWPMLFATFYAVSKIVNKSIMYPIASICLLIAFVASIVLARRHSECIDGFTRTIFGAVPKDVRDLKDKLEYYFVLFTELFLLAVLLTPYVHYTMGLTHIWDNDIYGFLELIGNIGYILLIIFLWFLLMITISSEDISRID